MICGADNENNFSDSMDNDSIGNQGVKASSENTKGDADYSILSPASVFEFASFADINSVREILDAQIEANMKLSECGLSEKCGAGAGFIWSETTLDDIWSKVISGTVAAVDARMSGCPYPAVINSGSGNQGIAASVPVILYGRLAGFSEDKIYRGLLMSNLTAIYIKQKCGILSACCGAVSAGAGAAAGIAFMEGLDCGRVVSYILGTLGGMFCDGAKSSCASKVFAALSVARLAIASVKADSGLPYGEGILGTDFEKTVENYGKIAKEGMSQTDDKLIEIMFSKC